MAGHSDAVLMHLVDEKAAWGSLHDLLKTVPVLVQRLQDIFASAAQEEAVAAHNNSNPGASTASLAAHGDTVDLSTPAGRRAAARRSKAGVSGGASPIDGPRSARTKRGGERESGVGSLPDVAQLRREEKDSKIRTLLERAAGELRQCDGLLPEYVWRLSDDEPVTSDENVPPTELQRRHELASTVFRVDIKLNGKVVTSTHYSALSPTSLSADFRQYFEFRVVHQPSEIVADIYSRQTTGCGGQEALVASVGIPHPGASRWLCYLMLVILCLCTNAHVRDHNNSMFVYSLGILIQNVPVY